MPLLEVNNLSVHLLTPRGPAQAVREVSFSLARGDTLGLIGESGCGKSITALSLMGLLPDNATVSGSIRFEGQELVGASDDALRELRGNRIGMIFQEPMTALNPVHTIGHQVAEPLRLHRGTSRDAARQQAIALLDRVGIANAVATQAAQGVIGRAHQLLAVKPDAAAHRGVVGKQAHQRQSGDRFTAARFANQAQGVTTRQ